MLTKFFQKFKYYNKYEDVYFSEETLVVHSPMENYFPLWAGMAASHLSLLDSVESQALNLIGISHEGEVVQGFLLSYSRQVSGLCFFFFNHLFSNTALSSLSVL